MTAGLPRLEVTVLLWLYSHIAHDCIIGNYCIMSNSSQVAGHVVMGDWAIIAGVCAVQQFSKNRSACIYLVVAALEQRCTPHIKAVQNPLSYGGVNSIGLKRRGFSLQQINHILDIYRIIYNKGMNVSQALEYIEEELQPPTSGMRS